MDPNQGAGGVLGGGEPEGNGQGGQGQPRQIGPNDPTEPPGYGAAAPNPFLPPGYTPPSGGAQGMQQRFTVSTWPGGAPGRLPDGAGALPASAPTAYDGPRKPAARPIERRTALVAAVLALVLILTCGAALVWRGQQPQQDANGGIPLIAGNATGTGGGTPVPGSTPVTGQQHPGQPTATTPAHGGGATATIAPTSGAGGATATPTNTLPPGVPTATSTPMPTATSTPTPMPTATSTPSSSGNLLANPGFESKYASWCVYDNIANNSSCGGAYDNSYPENSHPAHSGSWYGVHWEGSGSAYNVTTYQWMRAPTTATYTAVIWTLTGCNTGTTAFFLKDTASGQERGNVTISSCQGSWTRYVASAYFTQGEDLAFEIHSWNMQPNDFVRFDDAALCYNNSECS